MNMELFKSIALTFLVLSSLVLTWNVWSYQPPLDTIERSTTVEATIADRKETVDLIRPDRMLIHSAEDVYGTNDEDLIAATMGQLYAWTLFNVQNISTAVEPEDFFSIVHGENRVEIVFPTSIPLSTYGDILNFEDSNLPSATFDRIVVDTSARNEDTFNVYFVQYEERVIHEAKVNQSALSSFQEQVVSQAEGKYRKQIEYRPSDDRIIYLPERSVQMVQFQYVTTPIQISLFRDALFSNPNDVQLNVLGSNEEQYFDDSSLMKVNSSTRMINYVYPSAETDLPTTSGDLIAKSRSFVNEHQGWTNDYRLFDLDPRDQEVSYRLFVGSYPVFDPNGVTQISQEWGESRIYRYDRSYITLDDSLPERATKTLPGAATALEALRSIEGLDENKVEDLTLAYNMTSGANSELYTLEPAWYYKYDGSWSRLPLGDRGGEPIGLE